ncbi:response regulator [Phormidium sp. LEGE 05292]|uniref:hybrid sensor histidine kinase/response regulator n=1 Tax=[Phormidium] sp. LEGE 05292 TaxID=767427 RepID=UPI00187E0BCA|nr:hybrid sensor histidine kinase/response regulator [Phormidium sp. LEGE 05292]MBE9225670.1 response regulator [Phormidium sp. LEGE 05292]
MMLHQDHNKKVQSDDCNDDFLILEDETTLVDTEVNAWKVAIVDDDPSVHQATKLALKNFVFENKSLNFLSAYSGLEAKQLMAKNPDIAFILLDVVMETNDAGLQVVRYVREELNNQNVQIILRTGQPGEAPEESVIVAYNINDYKLKTELTRQKLITTVISALRTYQNAIALETQAKNLAQALHTLEKTQLQLIQSEKMSTLGHLITGIAYEINNPLGWISGNLSSLEETVTNLLNVVELHHQKCPNTCADIKSKIDDIDLEYLGDDLPKMIASTKEGVDRLHQLSHSLHTFAINNTGTKIPLNIHECIDSTLLIVKHRLKANNNHPVIEVVKDYGNIPLVESVPGQLNQVLMNLLNNAIDAVKQSNQGRSFADIQANPNRITIQTAWKDETHIVIRIKDNGVGMSEAIKQQAFEPFFTTKPNAQASGLGLAIARQIIVEKHGGSIEVTSSPGEGSEFAIVLPIN